MHLLSFKHSGYPFKGLNGVLLFGELAEIMLSVLRSGCVETEVLSYLSPFARDPARRRTAP